MKTVDTIEELIKTFQGIIQEGTGGPNSYRKAVPQDQMLHSVLDSAITSPGMSPKRQPKQQKVQKSPRQPKGVTTENSTQIPSKPQLSHQPRKHHSNFLEH